ncbi:MAG TPA: Mur ligase family protein [Candidatus Dojkabacteria bacterium]|nr:Mur ligase family protein [Candidatus Dojkabacteria bacterium]HRP51673.1 Mur ligase family protein [Candidatus Dojkabacteria bacterium]
MNFNEVEKYLYSRIKDKIDIGYSAGFSLERVKYTLELLGNPQEKIKIIHIAGTSGKGSTASFISKLLTSHGFKTGLTLSPHIQDIRERLQINNELIDSELFADNFTLLQKTFNEVEKSKYGSLSYFEMIICLAYYTFWKENVDYAVIETGLGGTYDATNCISNPGKVSVITKIGFDHMKILGNTLYEIARNKAGIIGEKQHVIYLSQLHTNKVIKNKIEEMHSSGEEIKIDELIKIYEEKFDFHSKDFDISGISIKNTPEYQIENFVLAVKTILYLSYRDNWKTREDILRKTFEDFNFSGRFELIESEGVKYILDGAHNKQKMEAFVSSLSKKYPATKFTMIIAFKADKDVASMLEILLPYAQNIYITSFNTDNQDISHKSFPANDIKLLLQSRNFSGNVKFEPGINNIIKELKLIYSNPNIPIVVTGSLYLVSEFKKHLLNKHQQ